MCFTHTLHHSFLDGPVCLSHTLHHSFLDGPVCLSHTLHHSHCGCESLTHFLISHCVCESLTHAPLTHHFVIVSIPHFITFIISHCILWLWVSHTLPHFTLCLWVSHTRTFDTFSRDCVYPTFHPFMIRVQEPKLKIPKCEEKKTFFQFQFSNTWYLKKKQKTKKQTCEKKTQTKWTHSETTKYCIFSS